MAKQVVYAIGGDIGGMREVYEGMKVLQKIGMEVVYFVDNDARAKAGTDFLAKQNPPVSYETRGPIDSDCPDVIVIGTSATAFSSQIAWTKYGHDRGISVIWVEDLYGTGQRQEALVVSPTVMLVIDTIAAKIASNVRPKLKTIIVGKPTFGKVLNEEQIIAVKQKIREELFIRDKFLLTISFGGDPAERAAAQLSPIIEVLEDFDVVCAFRFHPKHPQKDALWKTVWQSGLQYVDARKYDLAELNVASDAVFADWGNTDAIKAILGGVPTMTMLFPEEFMLANNQMFNDYERRLSAGYPQGIPPVIASHPEWGMHSPMDFRFCLSDIMEYPEYAREVMEERAKSFYDLLIPGAAERIAGEIVGYLK